MTPESFCERISAMPFGGVEVLSHSQFTALFREEETSDRMKGAAASLGERCGCGVLFIGGDDIYVRFTRKQTEAIVRRQRNIVT